MFFREQERGQMSHRVKAGLLSAIVWPYCSPPRRSTSLCWCKMCPKESGMIPKSHKGLLITWWRTIYGCHQMIWWPFFCRKGHNLVFHNRTLQRMWPFWGIFLDDSADWKVTNGSCWWTQFWRMWSRNLSNWSSFSRTMARFSGQKKSNLERKWSNFVKR